MEKELGKYTQQQETFLDTFIAECDKGTEVLDAAKIAKQAAEYSENYPVARIIATVREELILRCQDQLVMTLPKVVQEIVGVLKDPTKEGSRRTLEAATLMMDRAGLSKKEQVEVEVKAHNGIVILPPKQ